MQRFAHGLSNSQKVDRQVAKQYTHKAAPQKKKQVNYISVVTGLIPKDDKTSTTETKTSNMLPLVFCWSWEYKNSCTLNPQIPINNFTATVLSAANRGLKEKLTGEKLELSVDQVPNKFAIDEKAHVIFVIYAFGWDNVSIKPEHTDMIVSYKLSKEDTEVKRGVITIPYAPGRQTYRHV